VICRAVRLVSFLPILLFLLCASSSAQSPGKSKLSYKLLSIRVKGLKEFKDDQIIAASGLTLGQFAGEDEFKQAVNKLGETGLFINLSYSYQYSNAGCNLELQVAENDKLVPITFENLVWFSDDELLRLLRARLPLFGGRLPLGGNLADQISVALKSILAERRISGDVDYLRAAALEGPVDSYVYKLTFHPVLVRNMDFPGAAAAEIPALEAAGKSLSGQDYLRTKMRVQERLNFIPVYRSRGYLKAQFADAQAKVNEDGATTLVDVSFPVTPGMQYKLQQIEWAGNTVFPGEKLQELIHLKPNEPANAVQLDEDLEHVQKLYGTKGYLLASVSSVPEMDDAHSTVAFLLNVNEGELYRMGELEINGISADAAKKIATQWQLKSGSPYDDSYMDRFFKTTYRDIGLPGYWKIIPKKAINQQNKTVSVALHFVPKN
jgi:outer membrane protein assembly factor BamA